MSSWWYDIPNWLDLDRNETGKLTWLQTKTVNRNMCAFSQGRLHVLLWSPPAPESRRRLWFSRKVRHTLPYEPIFLAQLLSVTCVWEQRWRHDRWSDLSRRCNRKNTRTRPKLRLQITFSWYNDWKPNSRHRYTPTRSNRSRKEFEKSQAKLANLGESQNPREKNKFGEIQIRAKLMWDLKENHMKVVHKQQSILEQISHDSEPHAENTNFPQKYTKNQEKEKKTRFHKRWQIVSLKLRLPLTPRGIRLYKTKIKRVHLLSSHWSSVDRQGKEVHHRGSEGYRTSLLAAPFSLLILHLKTNIPLDIILG